MTSSKCEKPLARWADSMSYPTRPSLCLRKYGVLLALATLELNLCWSCSESAPLKNADAKKGAQRREPNKQETRENKVPDMQT
ncbi:hypothetical protein SDJN02_24351, partial [Cucurbita argyrosperma subsp. argyrosperma]